MSRNRFKHRLTRRRFLAASAAAALGHSTAIAAAPGSGVEIDRIDVFPMRYPTVGYFKFFEGPGGNYGRAAVMVKITADNGVVGWGQSVPVARWSYETLDTATIVLRDYLAPTLIGRDPLDILGAHKAMDTGLAPSFTIGMPIARAGLDLALHDLAGKLTGESLAQMWGLPRGGPLATREGTTSRIPKGTVPFSLRENRDSPQVAQIPRGTVPFSLRENRDSPQVTQVRTLRLSWTINARSLDEVDALIEAGRKRGYGNFNIKVAPDPKFDVQLAARVRKLAPEGFLWADANGGYDPATALEAAPKLADAGVEVLEAPVRPNRLSGYRALKRQGALPILMDEGVVSPVELREFIRLKMLDGVAMKPSRTGGLVSARRQIEILRDAGLMWLGSGLCDPDVSLAASLMLFGAFGLKKPAALNGPQFLTTSVLSRPLKTRGDMIDVPTGPGLGVDVDEAKLVEMSKQKRGHH